MSVSAAGRTLKSLRRVVLPLAVALVAALLPVAAVPALLPAANAADPCSPLLNAVACENSKPGSPPSEWDISGAGSPDIQGFSTEISVNAGQPVSFKVDTTAASYTIGIYRTGWYQGLGARKIADVTPSAFRQTQPQCLSDVTTELYDCGTWAVSATWQVPPTAVSGVYVALLTRADNGGQSHITFIVRSDGSRSDVLFQTSDPTWQAYNTYGGSDFYQGAANGRAYKISYNRPVVTRGDSAGRDFYFSNEYPLVRFLEKNGYDVSYISGLDTDRNGGQLLNHKVFLSVGHDEYWSAPQRASMEAARDAGVNLQFLSGNEGYWKSRFEPSPADGTAGRTITSYKETWSNGKIDPSTQWTGTWRDPRYASQANGAGLPENALTGTIYMSNYTDLPVTVSAEEGKTRLWRNTSLTSLAPGASAELAPHTVGYESDEDLDNGFRPAGLIRLSTTTGPTPQYLQDFGNTVLPGTTTHSVTLYKAASGALVFGAGSVQWTWGLDQQHDGNGAPADPRMQQAQINLLADMGAQPTTRDPALTAATASTDTTGPTVAVTTPAGGATVSQGSSVTVSGTAADTGGGVVAGVEVSTDGGTSWHPAQGKQNWSYSYIQKGLATAAVKVRAVDDSANIGTTTTQNLVLDGPYSAFGQTVPAIKDTGDGGSYELGMRFTPSAEGFITGVRFFKSEANTGTHTGSLWGPAGERLATTTFTSETASGWQEALFSQPVAVTPGQKYTVSYWAPNGRYSAKENQWVYAGFPDAPLTVAGGFGAEPAGVYGSEPGYPVTSFNNGNYFVDALFDTVDTSDLTASGQWPLDGSSSVPQATTVGAVLSKAVTEASVQLTLTANGAAVPGATGYDATTRKVTFTPAAGLELGTVYTATLSATAAGGGSLTSGSTWSFTAVASPPAPGSCPCSLFDDSAVPGIQEARDGVPLTLGVRFSSTAAGTVTGVRFYKSVGNTGTHTGTLFTASGEQLATVTFANESTSGWQTAYFNQPIAMTADTEYIMAYKSTTGSYSATVNGFGSGLSVGNLRTASDAGAYSYTNDFPSARSRASYLVDVVVQYPDPPFVAGAQTPLPGSSSVALDAPVSATLSKAPAGSSLALTLTGPDSVEVPGTAGYDTPTGKVTFTPVAPLAAATKYTATLTATSATGQALSAGGTWTFTTVPPPRPDGVCPCSLYQDSVTPGAPDFNDGVPLTLGVRFTSDSPGQVTGIRYYKSAGNTGTHTGALYTAGGQQLATVTFTGESSSGWQTAAFSQPVDIAANTEYVAAYRTPTGVYSATAGGIGSGFTSGPLRAASGAYTYSGDFPSSSSGASYLVDVAFVALVPPLSVTAQVPAADALGFPVTSKPAVTFSAPIQAGYTFDLSANGAAVAGTSALSADARTITFSPAGPLPTATVVSASVSNVVSAQGAALAPLNWQFTTSDPGGPGQSLFGPLLPSVPAASGDTSSIELGTVFGVSTAGSATGVRFYKGQGNTGTHVGSLWNAAGERLAQVTFADETATGWQTASFPAPVALSPGQDYVVSYLAPNGSYAYTPAFFAEPWINGILSAPGPNNGRYQYGSGGTMPANSWNATNYFVDIVFAPATP